MFEAILQATPWGFASVCVLTAAAFAILWSIIQLIRDILTRGGALRVGNVSLSGELEDGTGTPHSTCPHADDILQVAKRTMELSGRASRIHSEVLENQLKYCDEKLEEALSIMQHALIRIINNLTGNTIPFIKHEDYSLFELIADAIMPQIRGYIEFRFQDGKYAFYTPEAQYEYVRERRNAVIRKVTELLNMYWCCRHISRDMIYTANKDLLHQYECIVDNIFNEAFSIAREGYEQIRKTEDEYRLYLEGVTGKKDDCNFVLTEK